MSSPAYLRIGTLEIVLALALFALIVSRSRFVPGAAASYHYPVTVRLQVADAPGTASGPHEVSLTLGDGLPAALVGRSSNAEVGLLDPEVSRRHAQLQCVGGVLYLTDLGSSNGTFLNGKRLNNEGIEVRVGDDIDVGNARLRVVEASPRTWT